jgi:hypothetical protein
MALLCLTSRRLIWVVLRRLTIEESIPNLINAIEAYEWKENLMCEGRNIE